MIEAIAAYGLTEGLSGAASSATAVQSNGFVNWFNQELQQTNQSIGNADQSVKKLAAGEPVSLHDVMLSLEEARMQFQLVTQVRNKILDAYQDLMRMQI